MLTIGAEFDKLKEMFAAHEDAQMKNLQSKAVFAEHEKKELEELLNFNQSPKIVNFIDN